VDGDSNLLVADVFNHTLRKVTLIGNVSTFSSNRQQGFADRVDAAACFNEPWGIVVDVQDAIFVNDNENHCVFQPAGRARRRGR